MQRLDWLEYWTATKYLRNETWWTGLYFCATNLRYYLSMLQGCSRNAMVFRCNSTQSSQLYQILFRNLLIVSLHLSNFSHSFLSPMLFKEWIYSFVAFFCHSKRPTLHSWYHREHVSSKYSVNSLSDKIFKLRFIFQHVQVEHCSCAC